MIQTVLTTELKFCPWKLLLSWITPSVEDSDYRMEYGEFVLGLQRLAGVVCEHLVV